MTKELIKKWFELWEKGDFKNLPIATNFKHTSPFGTIEGKENYLSIVEANKDKFLGYTFKIHDGIYEKEKACVRYTGIQNDFNLDVSEWYSIKDNLIIEIFAYYHIGDIRDNRKLNS